MKFKIKNSHQVVSDRLILFPRDRVFRQFVESCVDQISGINSETQFRLDGALDRLLPLVSLRLRLDVSVADLLTNLVGNRHLC